MELVGLAKRLRGGAELEEIGVGLEGVKWKVWNVGLELGLNQFGFEWEDRELEEFLVSMVL